MAVVETDTLFAAEQTPFSELHSGYTSSRVFSQESPEAHYS